MKTLLTVVGALVPAAISVALIVWMWQIDIDTTAKLQPHADAIKNAQCVTSMQNALTDYKSSLDQFPNASAVAKEKALVTKELDLLTAYQDSCKCATSCGCCKEKCMCTCSCRGPYIEKQLLNSAAERLDPFRIKPLPEGKVNARLGYWRDWCVDVLIMGTVFGFLLSLIFLFVTFVVE